MVEGDAQALPFAGRAFDAVVSVRRRDVRARPARGRPPRCCASAAAGGTIALANWTPEGFIGGLFRDRRRHVPPPAGLDPPLLWGVEAHVRDLFGDGVTDVRARRREYAFRFDAPEGLTAFFREHYGPTVVAFAGLDPTERQDLRRGRSTALARRFDRHGGEGPSRSRPSTWSWSRPAPDPRDPRPPVALRAPAGAGR